MAASYTWPAGLPQTVRRDNYQETSGVLVLQTPMDAGPAKMRRRGAKPTTLQVGFYMTTAQVETLETFIKSTIKGTARFYFTHPRTGVQVEVRIVPSQEGAYYSAAFNAPGEYTVDLTLEILP
jgi:hypothetical protein